MIEVFVAVVAASGWLVAGLTAASRTQHQWDALHARAEAATWRQAYTELHEETRRRIRGTESTSA